MSEDDGQSDVDRAAALRAQIDEARAHLAATAEALAARAAERSAAPIPDQPAEQPAEKSAAPPPDRPNNLPVLYRPTENRRTVTVAGAVVGVVVLALRLRRRLRR